MPKRIQSMLPTNLYRADRTRWVWMLVLLACAILPYINTLWNGFVYDDDSQVLGNPYIRSFRYLREIFLTSVWSFTGTPSRYYRPIMTLGYLLCSKVFGISPIGFHLANIILHAGVVLLVFAVGRRIFGNPAMAFLGAAIFAVHPIHSESVAWIAGVTDVELAFFYLLTFWLFLSLDSLQGKRWWLAYFGMMLSFVAALLSKEQALTLPVIATLYENFYRQSPTETSWFQRRLRYAPLWGLTLAYIPLRMHALGGLVVTSNYATLGREEILLAGTSLIGQYIWKLLWPVNLSAFYVFQNSSVLLEPAVLEGLVIGSLLCGLLVWFWLRVRVLSFCVLWVVVTLAMVLNPRWLGINVFAERYLYLPSVGFCWVAAWGLLYLWRFAETKSSIWRRAMAAACILLALLCILRIVTRNMVWHDDITLYTETLESSPDAGLIEENLAAAYQNQGLLQEAESRYQTLLGKEPNCAQCLNDLSWLYIDQGRYEEAKPLIIKAVQLNPRLVSARLNLAIVLQKEGAVDRAQEQYRAAETIAPQSVYVQSTLAAFYQDLGKLDESETALKRAISIDPYNAKLRTALAELYEAKQLPESAIREFDASLEIDPGNAEAIGGLRRLGRLRSEVKR